VDFDAVGRTGRLPRKRLRRQQNQGFQLATPAPDGQAMMLAQIRHAQAA